MVIALILAGGSGTRMGATIPKQFIEVNGKPILAYTLEIFERHPLVDGIAVVCIEGWEDRVSAYREQYGISKLREVVTGGSSALESIRKGLDALHCEEDDIIVVHDGVRPLVEDFVISNVIHDCMEFGGAISSLPLIEHVIFQGPERTDLRYIPRENAFRAGSPQAYRCWKMKSAYRKSDETGIGRDSAFIGTLMLDVGEPVCLSKGSEKNVKITDPKDILYFKTVFE